MHFLRLAVLREFSLPDGLLPVIRDPCQYYPHSKLIKQQYGIVQGYRYYRKLREVTSTPSCSRPDVTVCPSTPSTPLHGATSLRAGLTLNKLVSNPIRKLHALKREPGAPSKVTDDVIDYVPVKTSLIKDGTIAAIDFAKDSTLPYGAVATLLPDVATYGSGNSNQLGVDNLTYRNDSSDSDHSLFDL